MIVGNKQFHFSNPEQILGMGGPWVGVLQVDERTVCENVLLDNLLLSEDGRRIFFVKYCRVSRWADKNFFTLNSVDIESEEVFERPENFKALYIKQWIGPNQIEAYNAFHDKIPMRRFTLTVGDERKESPAIEPKSK